MEELSGIIIREQKEKINTGTVLMLLGSLISLFLAIYKVSQVIKKFKNSSFE